MEKDVLLSVIMPVFNQKEYIKQALDSVLCQETDFFFEVLIGDDNSQDGVDIILKEYQKRFPDQIRLFLRETNLGATQNAYQLLSLAKGKYLATCEGDDYWTDPHKLQIQVDFLEAHPEFIGCVHPVSLVDENGTLVKQQELSWIRYKKVFTLDDYQGIYLPGHISSFVRKNIFLNPQYDYSTLYQASRSLADRLGMFLYLAQGNVYLIDKKMSNYRKVRSAAGRNITSQEFINNPGSIAQEFLILKKTEQYAQQVMGIPIFFEIRRHQLFTDACLRFLCGKGVSYFKTALLIFEDCTEKAKCILDFPAIVIQKLLRRNKKF